MQFSLIIHHPSPSRGVRFCRRDVCEFSRVAPEQKFSSTKIKGECASHGSHRVYRCALCFPLQLFITITQKTVKLSALVLWLTPTKCVISSPVLGIAVQINRFHLNYKVVLHLLAGVKCVGKHMQRGSRARCITETSLAVEKEGRRLHLICDTL